jgi:hypothetical protein
MWYSSGDRSLTILECRVGMIIHELRDRVMQVNTHDCTAHSALYTPGPNSIRPLFIFTDTWCSSGQFDGNGMLVQTGGDSDGVMKVYQLPDRLVHLEFEFH